MFVFMLSCYFTEHILCAVLLFKAILTSTDPCEVGVCNDILPNRN